MDLLGAHSGRLAVKQNFRIAAASVVTASYVDVVAAASNLNTTTAINIQNQTDTTVFLAKGAAASEVAIPGYIAPGMNVTFPIEVAKGIRIAAKALGANGTTGALIVNLLG
jgi:hypothetical protein